MREHGLTLQRSGIYAALPLAAGAIGCLLGGVIADWITRRTGSVTLGRRSVGAGGFLLGAIGYAAAMYAHSAEAAIAFLVLASGAHDLTLPVLWPPYRRRRPFRRNRGRHCKPRIQSAGMLAPLRGPARTHVRSFHAIFFVAAAMYPPGLRCGYHRSAKSLHAHKDLR
jgi:hypothetical protein